MFLIRDWSYPYEHYYGLEGGNTFLEKRLQVFLSVHTNTVHVYGAGHRLTVPVARTPHLSLQTCLMSLSVQTCTNLLISQ